VQILSPLAGLASATATTSSQASPANLEHLPRLQTAADTRFIQEDSPTWNTTLLGRLVVLEIYPIEWNDPETEERLETNVAQMRHWQKYELDGVDMVTLGRAAQTLERNSINWRQARDHAQVLTWANMVAPDSSTQVKEEVH